MAPYEALYGRKWRSSVHWNEVVKNKVIGSEVLQEIKDQVLVIRDRMKTVKVTKFGIKGKLCPRYVGSYKILEKVGAITYYLDLPTEFYGIHNVIHVSSLKNGFRVKTTTIMDLESTPLQPNLTYEEKAVQIIYYKEKKLHNCKISLVKVLWQNHNIKEATWEKEVDMKAKYPYLFGS
ncbi:hypothetical protein F2P56_018755 [Juglans regia]|uniref:Tf2-1-like SH3-like domain-containing protein n=1 Tax=Juglans regia TaxID=51240 RepID=A0A833X6N7_JUGRE|nr:hypothetical protein F2P56_018755 [Juglans regia]